MRTTFLIGNGFDIKLGLKTSYRDFYKYYHVKKESDHLLVKSLKYEIHSDYETWADLELALGEYTKKLKSRDEFDIVFEHIQENLAKYIAGEESRFVYDNVDLPSFYDDLVQPERYLPLADERSITSLRDHLDRKRWSVNVLNFNYTSVFENILNGKSQTQFYYVYNGNNFLLDIKISHVHGCVDDHIVIGVNDKSQIVNSEFADDIDITEALIKPECNMAMKNLADEDSLRAIEYSDLICIFGSSIGATDKIWWDRVVRRLLSDSATRLIIFAWGENGVPLKHKHKFGRVSRPIIENFLSKTSLDDVQKSLITPRIFVAYNTDIFNIKLKEKGDSILDELTKDALDEQRITSKI